MLHVDSKCKNMVDVNSKIHNRMVVIYTMVTVLKDGKIGHNFHCLF